jgi:gamma-polyglutamate synthase
LNPWPLILIGVYLLIKIVSHKVYLFHLRKIPLRIHVNGTRGKSQTTELITLGLQAGGIRTMGKITGNIPTIIKRNGSKVVLKRFLPASIREQKGFVRRGVQNKVQALVIECMAIMPELQWVSEHRMIRSGIGVITNARIDHRDVIGKSGTETAQVLSATIPSGGILFTSEKDYHDIFAKEAEKRGSSFVHVSGEIPIEPIIKGEIPGWIHLDNLSLALAVCRYAGVSKEVAIRGMLRAEGDAGRFTIVRININGKTIFFANAFSANDPVSTEILLKKTLKYNYRDSAVIGLFNHRKDRFFRTESFSEFSQKTNFKKLFLIGDPLRRPLSFLPETIDLSPIREAEFLWERLASEIGDNSVVFGFGNMSGIGLELSTYTNETGEQI